MKSIKLLAILLFSALLFTGCSLKNNDVIVKVNDKVITQADYDKLFNQTINNPGLQMFGLNKKNVDKQSFMYLMIKDRVVSELIIRSLVNEEMEKRHITVTKADAQRGLVFVSVLIYSDTAGIIGSASTTASFESSFTSTNPSFSEVE